MPQDRTAPPKEPTEWRAEPDPFLSLKNDDTGEYQRCWCVKAGDQTIAAGLVDELTARLFAAAPQKAALCEELADALEYCRTRMKETTTADGQPRFYHSINVIDAALAKAGRAPQ